VVTQKDKLLRQAILTSLLWEKHLWKKVKLEGPRSYWTFLSDHLIQAATQVKVGKCHLFKATCNYFRVKQNNRDVWGRFTIIYICQLGRLFNEWGVDSC
jgi:hypothetical protein